MPIDDELFDDARLLATAFGLEMVGIDYMVVRDGMKHLLELNHVSNMGLGHSFVQR